LLRKLSSIEGINWLRLLYTYPTLIDDYLIEIMATENKICRYLDLPLQHVSSRILKEMNRPADNDQIIRLVEKLRASIPGITLRTTFITGFPGEREDEFEELLDFIREVRFDRVGVFAYSQEENTSAAAMPDQVPEEVKQERQNRAMALQQEISLEINRGKINETITVLMEDAQSGRSEGDAPEIDGSVYVDAGRLLEPGEFVRVRITGAEEYDLTGVIVDWND
ncbi:MAG: radical SAM protein, partial [Peptococcaceae bacterium]|nr:radical SAM protein [Peptococcaceae bacterium]